MPMWSDVIARARQRLLVNVIVKQGAHALNACLGLLVAAVVLGTDLFHWRWLAIPPVIVLAIGVWYSWRRFPGTYSMAQLVDRRLGLSDVLSTAAFFSAAPSRGCDEGMRRAQAEMATRAAVDVRMSQAVPLRIPRAILYSVLLGGLIAGLLTVRYRFEGRPNFHRPMAPALHLLARLVEKEKAVEPEKKKEPEEEAQEGAATKGNKKTPTDQRMTWLLCNGDDQQCRHCDVVGEVNQAVRQRPRQIARIANDPASHDHCKYRENKVSNLHRGCLRF